MKNVLRSHLRQSNNRKRRGVSTNTNSNPLIIMKKYIIPPETHTILNKCISAKKWYFRLATKQHFTTVYIIISYIKSSTNLTMRKRA